MFQAVTVGHNVLTNARELRLACRLLTLAIRTESTSSCSPAPRDTGRLTVEMAALLF
jgi:hypothetical protein